MASDTTGSTEGARDELVGPRPLDPPLTFTRLLGAFILACILFFVMLVIFSFTGLGSIALAPAIVTSTALTGRIAHIRRLSALVLIGVLSFVFMVVLTYSVAIMVVLNSPK